MWDEALQITLAQGYFRVILTSIIGLSLPDFKYHLTLNHTRDILYVALFLLLAMIIFPVFNYFIDHTMAISAITDANPI